MNDDIPSLPINKNVFDEQDLKRSKTIHPSNGGRHETDSDDDSIDDFHARKRHISVLSNVPGERITMNNEPEEVVEEQLTVQDLTAVAEKLRQISRKTMGHFLAVESLTQEATQIIVDVASAFDITSNSDSTDEGNDIDG